MEKIFTADQLAAEWWWDAEYMCRKLHGTVLWDIASFTPDQRRVRLARLDPIKHRAFVEYIKPETRMRLVKK